MQYANDNQTDDARPWRWRNTRSIKAAVGIVPLPWDWQIAWQRWPVDGPGFDHAGVQWSFQFGPLLVSLRVDIGNCSADGWRGRVGLSEAEAWQRSGS